MGFAGKLDRFALTDVLQILANAEKTGTVHLTRRYDEGLIVMRRGRILYAASSTSRQTLGSLLVARGLIDENGLETALEELMDGSRERRLGTILVDCGFLDEESLVSVVREQIEGVISEFLLWQGAYFRFEPLKIPDHGEIEVDAKDFLLTGGLATDVVLLDLFSKGEPSASGSPTGARTESLQSLMNAVQPLEFTAESIARIRQLGEDVLARGMFLGTFDGGYYSMTTWGGAEAIPRSTPLPDSRGGLLRSVVESQDAHRGPVDPEHLDDPVFARLPGGPSEEVLVFPVEAAGRVVALLFGDGLRADEAAVEDLEIHLLELGLDLDRRVLERRRIFLERRRRALGDRSSAGSPPTP